ncbi:MAG: serine--tRNA ligase, partial [Clostridia bacterium]|nr:serine--tRNA ligase [Clostridia bacterium]
MLDIKFIKENPELVKERLASRQKDYSADIDRLLTLDVERRALIADTEQKKAEQNRISKQIPALKKEGKDVAPIFAEMKKLSETVKADEVKISAIDSEISTILLSIPNTPNEKVPVGKDDTDNVEMRRWGEP